MADIPHNDSLIKIRGMDMKKSTSYMTGMKLLDFNGVLGKKIEGGFGTYGGIVKAVFEEPDLLDTVKCLLNSTMLSIMERIKKSGEEYNEIDKIRSASDYGEYTGKLAFLDLEVFLSFIVLLPLMAVLNVVPAWRNRNKKKKGDSKSYLDALNEDMFAVVRAIARGNFFFRGLSDSVSIAMQLWGNEPVELTDIAKQINSKLEEEQKKRQENRQENRFEGELKNIADTKSLAVIEMIRKRIEKISSNWTDEQKRDLLAACDKTTRKLRSAERNLRKIREAEKNMKGILLRVSLDNDNIPNHYKQQMIQEVLPYLTGHKKTDMFKNLKERLAPDSLTNEITSKILTEKQWKALNDVLLNDVFNPDANMSRQASFVPGLSGQGGVRNSTKVNTVGSGKKPTSTSTPQK